MTAKNMLGKLAAIVLVLLLASAAWADGAKSIAVVIAVKGECELKKAGTNRWNELKFGAVLDGGDFVRTGKNSFAALAFTDDKSQLKLRPETEIALNATRQEDYSLAKRVNMELGELFSEVKKQKGSLQIATPTAVASVKGTEFWVLVGTDGQTEVLALEGIIELLSQITGESVEVVAGQMGAVNQDGELDLSVLQEQSLPEMLDEMEVEYIELEFQDEDGNTKRLIIQYREHETD